MILYCDTVRGFIHDCTTKLGGDPVIGQLVLEKLKQKHVSGGSNGEYESWIHSLPEMAKTLDDPSICPDAHVGVEYKLIDTRQRVDFLIYGLDERDSEHVVLVELKQWSDVRRSSLRDYVRTDGGHGPDDYWHPSYQALNYANIMKGFNEYVYSNKVEIDACSFLHNMPDGYGSLLKDERTYPLIHKAPAFLKGDKDKLRSFIAKYVKKPHPETLYEIDMARIRPSAQFANMVSDAIKGKPFFSYDAEQSYSVAKIVGEVNEALERGERRTLIIKGGPGSGKSVVAINALGQLMNPLDGSPRRNACYVTANFTPRTYFGDVLTEGDFTKKAIKELFKTPAAFARVSCCDFDCVIVDEAHRMLPWKFGWGVQRDVDCIDRLFYASRVNVFFIDEDQVVTTNDDLSIRQIKEYADKYGSKVIEEDRMILSSQFRCVGGEQYIEFVNRLLGYHSEFVSLRGVHYDVRVMDSMSQMMSEMRKLNTAGHQFRLMAGYTHEWKSERDPSQDDFEYENGAIRLKWNVRKSNGAAVLDPAQSENVFSIFTIQGLEVEYAGVIIGKDLTYNERTKKLEFHKDAHPSTDSAQHGGSGIAGAPDDLAESLIRNTYKVLLTRGVKGTYIYAEDKALRKFLERLTRM